MATYEISPGNAQMPSRLCLPHLHIYLPCKFRTLEILDSSSGIHASYVISVRQTNVLPVASFRFSLTTDTLALRLTIPLTGLVGDFHSQAIAPCRAHRKKRAALFEGSPFYFDSFKVLDNDYLTTVNERVIEVLFERRTRVYVPTLRFLVSIDNSSVPAFLIPLKITSIDLPFIS